MSSDTIRVVGARVHNLKNITVEIPRDKLVVITGLSGSGKSSLAFDTIFAEGQRRYVESLSAYARQFIGQMDKPDVDYIDGLSPAVSIDQKSTSHNPRSTVGTVTEIYDYMRLLFARAGIPHCPICGREVVKQSAEEIVDKIEKLPDSSRVLILSPLVRARKGTYQAVFEEIRKAGFARARVDGNVHSLDDEINLDRYKQHTIEAVVDRLVISQNGETEDKKAARTRLTDSVETALKFGEGYVSVNLVDQKQDIHFSEHLACPEHGVSISEVEPRTFSFNTPQGACPDCQGLGSKLEIDPERIIPDSERSLNEGAIASMEWSGPKEEGGYYWQGLQAAAKAYRIDLDKPVHELTQDQLNIILYGTGERQVQMTYRNSNGHEFRFSRAFEGVITNLERRYRETNSEYIREKISEFMSDRPCPTCKGKRLNPAALAVTVDDINIITATAWPVLKTLAWVKKLSGKSSPLTPKQRTIAERVLKEIHERLTFLVNVGLEYLTLNRSATTLSGGEAQRIRLATQVGSRLVGVLYVLDEPSIGLHPRDNRRLLDTLAALRDLGNTVLVVEHDEETIRRADYVVDLGPGAGTHGGVVVARGTADDVARNRNSVTGLYISGERKIPIPDERRLPNGKAITIRGAHHNNLKDIDVSFPLGLLTVVTGVSGSGKSTLVQDILYRALAKELYGSLAEPGAHQAIDGLEHLDKVIEIDQSPIGRTPRSNPATYTGLFTPIRELYAMLPESRERGYKPGRFSFNVKGGRCEGCEGDGMKRIEMNFLPDVYVLCDVCRGARYNRETLSVRYKGKSIAELLDTTVEEALPLLENIPQIQQKLQTILDVGLGYLKLGQSATTLSGGEAQRIKLAKELSKRATGRTVYILDEPTTGLHFADVHKLLDVLQRLVSLGNTVIVIEHNLDVIKSADYVIDLGPEGGTHGGRVVASGTPEEVARSRRSHTGQVLRPLLNGTLKKTGNGVRGEDKKIA